MTAPTIDLDRITSVLSPAQIRSIVEAGDTPQIALWSGAVSSGKTIASLIAFLIALADAPAQGLVVIVGRTLQTIERNILDPLQEPALFDLVADQVHHTRGSTIATILGRTVHLVGANDVRAEGRIRGATVALAYVDEATLVPRGFWLMLLSRLRVRGAKLLATTNPDNPGHWLRKEFMSRADEVGMRRWHFTLDDNPALDPAYVARLKRQYVGLWYRRFIEGRWVRAEGAIYDMWDEDRHVVDIVPRIDRWVALGIDYGTSNPFAAELLGMATGPDGASRLYLTNEWRYEARTQRRQLTDVEYSQRLRGWLADLAWPGEPRMRGVRPQWTVVDPSAASFVTQLHRDGLMPALADNSVLDGIRTVSSLLAAGRLLVHRSCAGLIEEIGGYAWDEKAAEAGEDKPIKVDDHSCDALRYGIHTTQASWRSQLDLAA